MHTVVFPKACLLLAVSITGWLLRHFVLPSSQAFSLKGEWGKLGRGLGMIYHAIDVEDRIKVEGMCN